MGWKPSRTPSILFPGPGYIEISEGEATIFLPTTIQTSNPKIENVATFQIQKNNLFVATIQCPCGSHTVFRRGGHTVSLRGNHTAPAGGQRAVTPTPTPLVFPPTHTQDCYTLQGGIGLHGPLHPSYASLCPIFPPSLDRPGLGRPGLAWTSLAWTGLAWTSLA